VERQGEFRQYQPRSDFLFSNSALPRLLVEVNSTSTHQWPMDLVRMLTTGAFIVRFANQFLNAFKAQSNFVLCAIFIWGNGDAVRYTLFQKGNDRKVCCDVMNQLECSVPLGLLQQKDTFFESTLWSCRVYTPFLQSARRKFKRRGKHIDRHC
jgi:hypothetical protein